MELYERSYVELEDVKAECARAGARHDTAHALATLAELPQAFTECKRLGHFEPAEVRAAKKSSPTALKVQQSFRR